MTLPRNINLQLLEHLKALIAERHVTRAAESVGIGQPAMSASLARLRVMLKDPLLVKTARGMEPTPYALELAKAIHGAFELLDATQHRRSEFDIRTADRTIRVISADGPALLLLPPLTACIREQAPRLVLRWTHGDMRRAAELLRDGEVDLVISSLRSIPETYYSSPLYAQRACCIAAKGHPAIEGALTMEQFLTLHHVAFGSTPNSFSLVDSLVDEVLAGMGHKRHTAVTVPSFLACPPVVARSDLIAVVPDRVAAASAAHYRLQILAMPFELGPLDLAMYWHARCHADPAHQWVRAALREFTDSAQHPSAA